MAHIVSALVPRAVLEALTGRGYPTGILLPATPAGVFDCTNATGWALEVFQPGPSDPQFAETAAFGDWLTSWKSEVEGGAG